MRRFLIVFPVLLLVGFGLLLAPFTRSTARTFTSVVVSISAHLVSLAGGQAVAVGDILRNPLTGYSIRVADTCNASNVTVLLVAAILAFPARWRQKIAGVLVGLLVLHAVNLVRITSLFYIGQHEPGWFEFAHLCFWESLIVIFTLVIFWSWVQHTHNAR